MSGGLPVFPNIRPGAIVKTRFYPFIDSDINTEADAEQLSFLMFHDTEASFYYYHAEGEPTHPLVASGEYFYCEETHFDYYQHLSTRDFVQISPRSDGTFKWEWEQTYVETRPRFVKHILKLSARKRRQLEVFERLHLEHAYREQQYSIDVFLSFGSADRAEAEAIQQQLSLTGAESFLAPKDLRPGDDFGDVIRKALRNAKEVWLLLTPASLQSEWVTTEWGAAWVLEKRIVPILLRCAPTDLSARLQALQCIDFHKIGEFIRDRFAQPEQSSPP